MSETGRTELGNFVFKAKEGIGFDDVYIDAEPQSETGAMPGGIAALGFTLYTDDIREVERIADFLNKNIHQVFIARREGKCVER